MDEYNFASKIVENVLDIQNQKFCYEEAHNLIVVMGCWAEVINTPSLKSQLIVICLQAVKSPERYSSSRLHMILHGILRFDIHDNERETLKCCRWPDQITIPLKKRKLPTDFAFHNNIDDMKRLTIRCDGFGGHYRKPTPFQFRQLPVKAASTTEMCTQASCGIEMSVNCVEPYIHIIEQA